MLLIRTRLSLYPFHTVEHTTLGQAAWQSRPFVGLIVGNGLSISLAKLHADLEEKWHPSRPLSFEVPTPRSGGSFLDKLPYLKAALEYIRTEMPCETDFDVFREILKYSSIQNRVNEPPPDEKHASRIDRRAATDARHYLALAYAHLSLEYRKYDWKEWVWSKWFLDHRHVSLYVVSFNYDVNVEKLLGRGTYQHGHQTGSPVVFKPHGSMNYDAPSAAFGPTQDYPLNAYIDYNYTPLYVLPPSEWLGPRRQANLILPNEESWLGGVQWNKPAWREYQNLAPHMTHLIVAGFSYSEPDKREMNFFLDKIAKNARIYVVNLNMPPELENALRVRGLEPTFCGLEPPRIP